jgi:hypothetical protein
MIEKNQKSQAEFWDVQTAQNKYSAIVLNLKSNWLEKSHINVLEVSSLKLI